VIVAMEFKVGEREFARHALNQAWDYALDLKNFHLGSHHAPIVPMLVATEEEGNQFGKETRAIKRLLKELNETPKKMQINEGSKLKKPAN
jgi:hypothetical protein